MRWVKIGLLDRKLDWDGGKSAGRRKGFSGELWEKPGGEGERGLHRNFVERGEGYIGILCGILQAIPMAR